MGKELSEAIKRDNDLAVNLLKGMERPKLKHNWSIRFEELKSRVVSFLPKKKKKYIPSSQNLFDGED